MEVDLLCVESKGGKPGKPLAMHPRQNWYLTVHVVMNLNSGLLVSWPQYPADLC